MTIFVLRTSEKMTKKNFKNSLKSAGNFPHPIIRVRRGHLIDVPVRKLENDF